MTKKEIICEWCGLPFFSRKKKQKFCSNECCLESNHATRKTTYANRLHDGMRLLSDDFGEQDGDESVTFQK